LTWVKTFLSLPKIKGADDKKGIEGFIDQLCKELGIEDDEIQQAEPEEKKPKKKKKVKESGKK